MNKNIPEGEDPLYDYGYKSYRGEAVDGPFNGEILTNTVLTMFVTKIYKAPIIPYTATLEEQLALEKKHRLEAEENKKHPDRYDFDIQKNIWVWVEYIKEQGE